MTFPYKMGKVSDMKRARERISKKLRNNAGESLAEVLIALLIAALALRLVGVGLELPLSPLPLRVPLLAVHAAAVCCLRKAT